MGRWGGARVPYPRPGLTGIHFQIPATWEQSHINLTSARLQTMNNMLLLDSLHERLAGIEFGEEYVFRLNNWAFKNRLSQCTAAILNQASWLIHFYFFSNVLLCHRPSDRSICSTWLPLLWPTHVVTLHTGPRRNTMNRWYTNIINRWCAQVMRQTHRWSFRRIHANSLCVIFQQTPSDCQQLPVAHAEFHGITPNYDAVV
jgi:hypothetical protein